MAHVRIICDGGGEYGFGNLRRSATLAAAFQAYRHEAHVDVQSEEGRKLLPSEPLGIDEPDIWLLDVPYEGDAWVAAARAKRRPIIALDYVGKFAPDLIISIFNRGKGPAGVPHLVGFDYAIIDPRIAKLAPAAPGKHVVIIIGGGDRHGLSEDAALALHAQGCDVTVIDGPLALATKELPPQIRRVSCPADLAERMAASEWAVTSGGGAMMEMFCLGKPVHVLPRTESEAALASLALQRGAVLGVGLQLLRKPSNTLLHNVSAAARSLVDGKGAERIVQETVALL